MPDYDRDNASPPAPIASVVLRNPDSGAEIKDVPMLLDTGADVTLIPRDASAHIGCRSVAAHQLAGFDGDASGVYDEVTVEMVFLSKSFRGQFLTIEQPIGILGRNILNYLVLTFDGPRLVWEEVAQSR